MHELANYYLYVREVQFLLQSGSSLRTSINEISENTVATQVKGLVYSIDQGAMDVHLKGYENPLVSSLESVLIMGLEGHGIIQYLNRLEVAFFAAIEEQMQIKLQQLPVKVLIPLLLFMLPAYLILMIGPILIQFLGVL